MAVGSMPKNMPTHSLVKVLRTSSYDVTPDPESTLKKVKKQLARARMNAIPSGKGLLRPAVLRGLLASS
eukprot:6487178-Pyramimonas_sp.AAC.1